VASLVLLEQFGGKLEAAAPADSAPSDASAEVSGMARAA
jgi:hypothetical protein